MPVSCGSRPSGSSKSLSLHWTCVVHLSTCSPEWVRSLSDRIAEEIAVIDPERKQREEKPRPQIRGLGPEASRPFIIRSFQILEKHLATLGPDHHARGLRVAAGHLGHHVGIRNAQASDAPDPESRIQNRFSVPLQVAHLAGGGVVPAHAGGLTDVVAHLHVVRPPGVIL